MSFSHLIRVHVGAIPKSKLSKALKTGKLSLTAAELAGTSHTLHVHPEVAEKLLKAKKNHKGARFYHSMNEIRGDMQNMQGGSLWSWLAGAAKTGYKAVKDNWKDIQPLLTKGIDQYALPAGMNAAGPYAPAVLLARQGLKALTGVGVKPAKGSQAAKDKMARVRAMRKKGGSFLPAGGYA